MDNHIDREWLRHYLGFAVRTVIRCAGIVVRIRVGKALSVDRGRIRHPRWDGLRHIEGAVRQGEVVERINLEVVRRIGASVKPSYLALPQASI